MDENLKNAVKEGVKEAIDATSRQLKATYLSEGFNIRELTGGLVTAATAAGLAGAINTSLKSYTPYKIVSMETICIQTNVNPATGDVTNAWYWFCYCIVN